MVSDTLGLPEVFEYPKSMRSVAAGSVGPGFLDAPRANWANGHARRLGSKIAATAATSKELLVSAMTKIGEGSSRLWRTGLPPLPPGLHERPEGVVRVAESIQSILHHLHLLSVLYC